MQTLFDFLPDPEGMSLEQAQKDLSQNVAVGTHCLCCGTYRKIQHPRLQAETARILCWLVYKFNKTNDWVAVQKEGDRRIVTSNSVGKLLLWGLAQRKPNVEDPTKKHLGLYRPTPLGVEFVNRQARIAKRVYTYNEIELSRSTETVDIVYSFGVKFDYRDVMSPAYWDKYER